MRKGNQALNKKNHKILLNPIRNMQMQRGPEWLSSKRALIPPQVRTDPWLLSSLTSLQREDEQLCQDKDTDWVGMWRGLEWGIWRIPPPKGGSPRILPILPLEKVGIHLQREKEASPRFWGIQIQKCYCTDKAGVTLKMCETRLRAGQTGQRPGLTPDWIKAMGSSL